VADPTDSFLNEKENHLNKFYLPIHCGGANPKFEYRNPKSTSGGKDQNNNDPNIKSIFGCAFVWNFDHLNFGIVSDFDIRISNFNFYY
jgi:hypothetical protein